MEIDQQPDVLTTQPHVRKQFRLVNQIDGCNAFDLDNDGVFYDEIDSVSQINFFTIVNNGQTYLTCQSESWLVEFME